jgi:heat shock protein HslJ
MKRMTVTRAIVPTLLACAALLGANSSSAVHASTGLHAVQSDDAPPDRAPVNTYWRLVELRGAPVVVTPNQREAHLVLQITGDRVVGSGGCNRLTGEYALHGDFVRFSGIAATRKACAGGMAQEAAFLRALDQVKSWRVHGDELSLLDSSSAVILRFAAVDLR